MTNNDQTIIEMRKTLEAIPNWMTLNANERTKLCCAEFVRRGMSLPAWMGIRDVIGKGSASDIHRGKAEYRIEHAEQLRKMEGFSGGLPDELAPHIQGFWQAAIAFVRENLNSEIVVWTEQVSVAQTEAENSQKAEHSAKQHAETLIKELAASKELQVALNAQIDSERMMRKESEARLDAHIQEMQQQRETLERTLIKSQEDMSAALQRFDGERRHAMMQIEEARTNAKKTVEELRDRFQHENKKLDSENVRLTQTLGNARAQLVELEHKITVLETKNQEQAIEIARLRDGSYPTTKALPRGTLLKQRKSALRIKNRTNGAQ